MIHIEPGEQYLLDGKTTVVVLKPFNRSQSVYKIEVPGRSVELVERERLTLLPGILMKEKDKNQ